MTRSVSRSFGRYELLTELGRGGMAELHLARLSGIGGFEKLVAIKVMLPHLSASPEFVELFLNEGRIAARISHPNVCQVFEIGEHEGQLFLVMEYLEGVTWEEMLRVLPEDPVTMLRVTTGVIAQMADGLHHAHELRDADGAPTPVVHRDVSPSNLFITSDGVCKLLDFGVAKETTQGTQTRTGVLKGKLPYMSPEQIKGEPIDPRSDIFSTGTLLWEALAGRPLFLRDAEFNIWLAVTSEPIDRVSAWEASYGPAVDAVVMRALQRDREARYASMRELAEALRASAAPWGGPMSPAEIGELVRTRCSDKLVARSVELASLEVPTKPQLAPGRNDETVTDAPAIASVVLRAGSVALERPRRPRWPFAVGAAVLAAAIAMVLIATRTDEAAPAVAARVDAPPPPAPPVPVAEPEIEIEPAEPTPSPQPSAVRRRATQRARPEVAERPIIKLAPGSLSIDAKPGARIYVDGVFVDDTPLFKHPLSAGTHEVRLVRGAGDAWTRAIKIQPNQLTNLGTIQW